MDILRSLPLGLYLEQPTTWLHRLDPRVKLFWLMGFLLTPVLARDLWRIALVVLLMLLTIVARVPLRVWRQQLGWLTTLCLLIFAMTAITPDGLLATHTPHRSPNSLELEGPPLPAQLQKKVATTSTEQVRDSGADTDNVMDSATGDAGSTPRGAAQSTQELSGNGTAAITETEAEDGAEAQTGTKAKNNVAETTLDLPPASSYQYILFDYGFVTISQRSLDLAIRVSTLIFTLIYSTNLYLLTTAPEEITQGLEDLMLPLRWVGLPVTELSLTLTLALRYIPLVLEEIQNLGRSVWTRAINWKELGMRRGLRVWVIVAERLLENLLLRASQAANAMRVRGFTGPNQHRVQWHDLRIQRRDWLAIAALLLFCGLRTWVGGDV